MAARLNGAKQSRTARRRTREQSEALGYTSEYRRVGRKCAGYCTEVLTIQFLGFSQYWLAQVRLSEDVGLTEVNHNSKFLFSAHAHESSLYK